MPIIGIVASSRLGVLATTEIELFVVAGGGGCANAGGGAGGLSYQASRAVVVGTAYAITIGAGGTNGQVNGDDGTQGSDSNYASLIISNGGGRARILAGMSGGSGAGGYSDIGGSATQGNTSSATGFGNAGGAGAGGYGGGGGGAGAAGGGGTGVSGGAGRQYWNESGTSTFYGGGGGGYNYGSNIAFAGGSGGGGTGVASGNTGAGGINTGGGGGAAYDKVGTGGSGVVILRYLKSKKVATSTTGSPTVGTDSTYRYYKFTGTGSITF